MESDGLTPGDRLDALDRSREALRARTVAPPWFYAALGVAVAGFTLILLLPPDLRWLAYAAYLVVWVAIAHVEVRVRGLQLEPRSRPWPLVLCALGGAVVSYPLYVLSRSVGQPWVIVPLALLLGVVSALLAWRGDAAVASRLQDDGA